MTDVQAPNTNERLALGRLLLQGLEGASDTVHLMVGNALYSHDPAALTVILTDLPVLHGSHPAWRVIEGWLGMLTGRLDRGMDALAGVVDAADPPLRALARIFMGACRNMSDADPAGTVRDLGALLAASGGDHPWIRAHGHIVMGNCSIIASEAFVHFATAAAAFKQVGDHVGQSKAVGDQAIALARWGRLEEALPLFQQAVDIGREAMRVPGAMIYSSWADVLDLCGRWEDAEAKLSEGIALAEMTGLHRALFYCLRGRAVVRMASGRLDEAEADVGAMQERAGSFAADGITRELTHMDVALYRRELAKAEGFWRQATEELDRQPGLYARLRVSFAGIRLALCQRDPDRARAIVATLLQELEPSSFGFFQAQTLYFGHVASLMQGDEAEAARCRAEALAIVSPAVWEAFARKLPPWARERHMPGLTVRMFGPLDVQTPTDRSVFGASQGALPRQLLASLIVTPAGLTGEQLLQRLYDDNTERRKALISLIHRLRDSLDEALGDDQAGPSITYTTPRYHLTSGWPLTSDLDAFRAAREAWRLSEQPAERAVASERLIDLYTGPLLEDLPDEPWIAAAREDVREQWLSVVEWYVAHLARLGEIEKALGVIERAATTDSAASRARLRQALTKI